MAKQYILKHLENKLNTTMGMHIAKNMTFSLINHFKPMITNQYYATN